MGAPWIAVDDEVRDMVRRAAQERGVTEADLVRDAVAAYLRTSGRLWDPNPLAELAGIVDDGSLPPDASEEHDREIYGESA